MNETEFNARLLEVQESIYNRLPVYRRNLKLAFVRAKESIERIIAKYLRNNLFPRSRINSARREIDAVMAQLARDLATNTEVIVTDVTERASTATNAALLVAAGLSASLALDAAVATTTALTGLGGVLLGTHIATILELVFDREGSDSFVLRDRFRIFADGLAQDVMTSLRATIANSEEIDDIPALVNQVFGTNEWRVDRIADTEVAYALRSTIAEGAQYSELVEAIKIIDFPHGHHHDKHECFKLAHRDAYGLGMGIYPIGNEQIRNPHPQCRSRLVLIMREGAFDA